MTFLWHDVELDYFDHPYNSTALNERTIEVPVARAWIAAHGIDTEVGNVLGHYSTSGHRVVDRYEHAPGVENVDVFDLDGDLGSVVAISTLEHVRWDEPDKDPDGAVDALRHLAGLADRLLVTVPLGHNPTLDAYLLVDQPAERACTFVRCWSGWVQTAHLETAPYGATTKWAEALWVGEW